MPSQRFAQGSAVDPKSPLPAEASARLSQKCEAVYKITEKPQPKFVRTDVIVEKGIYSSHILIKVTDVYENSEDNIVKNCGQFYYRNDDELEEIVRKLQRLL